MKLDVNVRPLKYGVSVSDTGFCEWELIVLGTAGQNGKTKLHLALVAVDFDLETVTVEVVSDGKQIGDAIRSGIAKLTKDWRSDTHRRDLEKKVLDYWSKFML